MIETKELDDVLNSEKILLIRTDYSNDEQWEYIKEQINKPEPVHGFKANVDFLSNKKYDGIDISGVAKMLAKKYKHYFVFIADKESFDNLEYPILCLDVDGDLRLNHFRFILSVAWEVENNLFTSNIDFEDFINDIKISGDNVFKGSF